MLYDIYYWTDSTTPTNGDGKCKNCQELSLDTIINGKVSLKLIKKQLSKYLEILLLMERLVWN